MLFLENIRYVFALLIFLLMIVFSTSIEKSGSNAYILVAITGVFLYFFSKKRALIFTNSDVDLYSKICAAFLFFCIASYAFNGFKPEQLKSLESPFLKIGLLFFFTLGVVFVFQKIKSNVVYFFLAMLSVISFFISLDQFFSIGIFFPYASRAHGVVNPIYFGNIALISGYLCVMYGASLLQNKKYALTFILAICGAAGLVASILSQSRGGWLSLLFFIPFLFWYCFRVKSFANLYLLLFFIFMASLVGYKFGGVFYDRVLLAYHQINNYSGLAFLSFVGFRLRLWS